MFITGHTHAAYNCVIDGRPVTSASSNGRLVTDLELTLGRRRRHHGRERAKTCRSSRRGPDAAADVQALVDRYEALSAPLRRTPVGRISQDITRDIGHRRLGRERARQRDRRRPARRHRDAGRGAVIALMNPGGVRTDFIYAPPSGEATGQVTYERGVHGPAVQQPRRHPDVHGGAGAGRAQGPVVRDEHVADGAVAVELDPLLVLEGDRREHPRQAVRRGREPGQRRDDRRRGARTRPRPTGSRPTTSSPTAGMTSRP